VALPRRPVRASVPAPAAGSPPTNAWNFHRESERVSRSLAEPPLASGLRRRQSGLDHVSRLSLLAARQPRLRFSIASVLAMRRTVLSSIVFTSLTALSVAIGACATAPVDDDLSGLTQEQNPTDATDEASPSSKLPPSSNPSKDEPKDAGTTQPKDSGTTQPKDAGTTPVDSGPPPTSDACDANDPTYALKLLFASNPTPCPCSSSTECCYLAVCLPK